MKASWDRWAEETGGVVSSVADFVRWKGEGEGGGGRVVLGVMGFAGAWHRSGHRGAALDAYIAGLYAAIDAELAQQQAAHGSRLVVASGATNLGVLQVTYARCAARGIVAVGIAPSAVLRYTLAPALQRVVPVGTRFGDESAVFVEVCDAFLLVGGGKQSAAETRMAHARGRPLTVVQGFGGAADAFTAEALGGAGVRWVRWDHQASGRERAM